MEKVQLQNEFWAIEVTNNKGEVGFVIKTTEGISVTFGEFNVATTMFKTRSDANNCINKNKLYRRGKTRIITGSEISERFGSRLEGEKHLWVIQNEDGLYLKYSAEKNVGYFFEKGEVGAIAFDSVIHMNEFIEKWQPEFKVSKFIPKIMKNDPPADDNKQA